MRNRRILVIEDDHAEVPMLEEALRTAGVDYDLVLFCDGEQAILHLRHCRRNGNVPDLVFVDMMLPRQSGLEVLREIRLELGRLSLPIILWTSTATAPDDSSSSIGVLHAMEKPVNRTGYTRIACFVKNLLDQEKISAT